MNTTSPPKPLVSQLRDEAHDAVRTASDAAQNAAAQASDSAKSAYQAALLKAEGTYQNVRAKADETLRTVRAKADETAVATGEYVRQHPMPSLLGAVALGVGLGFLLAVSARRPPLSLREQFVDEPLDAAREALYAVLAPVAQRIRGSYEGAHDSVEHALGKVHQFDGSNAAHSLAGQVRRVGGNLKFW